MSRPCTEEATALRREKSNDLSTLAYRYTENQRGLDIACSRNPKEAKRPNRGNNRLPA